MGFRTRPLIGYLFNNFGEPIVGGKISIKPDIPLGFTSTHLIVDQTKVVETESDGKFEINAWVDEDSLTPVNQLLTFPITSGGDPDPKHTAKISLGWEGGTPKDIGAAIIETTPSNLIPVENLRDVVTDLIGDYSVVSTDVISDSADKRFITDAERTRLRLDGKQQTLWDFVTNATKQIYTAITGKDIFVTEVLIISLASSVATNGLDLTLTDLGSGATETITFLNDFSAVGQVARFPLNGVGGKMTTGNLTAAWAPTGFTGSSQVKVLVTGVSIDE